MEDTRGARWTGNPGCPHCGGGYWIDYFEMFDGKIIKGVEQLIEEYATEEDPLYESKVKRSSVEPCRVCETDPKVREYDQERDLKNN